MDAIRQCFWNTERSYSLLYNHVIAIIIISFAIGIFVVIVVLILIIITILLLCLSRLIPLPSVLCICWDVCHLWFCCNSYNHFVNVAFLLYWPFPTKGFNKVTRCHFKFACPEAAMYYAGLFHYHLRLGMVYLGFQNARMVSNFTVSKDQCRKFKYNDCPIVPVIPNWTQIRKKLYLCPFNVIAHLFLFTLLTGHLAYDVTCWKCFHSSLTFCLSS